MADPVVPSIAKQFYAPPPPPVKLPDDPFAEFPDASTADVIAAHSPPAPQPSAPTPPAEDPFAEFPDAELPPGVDANDEFAEFQDASAIDTATPEQLLSDPDFNVIQFLRANPEALDNPVTRDVLVQTLREKEKRGLEAGKVAKNFIPGVVHMAPALAKGLVNTTERLIDVGLQPAVNAFLSLFQDEETRRGIIEGTKKSQKKSLAELQAGTEAAAFDLSNLLRQGSRKIRTRTDAQVNRLTDDEIVARALEDVEFLNQSEQILQGRGVVAQATGLDADKLRGEGVELDPAVIESISYADPLTLVALPVGGKAAFSLVTKGGKKLASFKTVQQGMKLAERIGSPVIRAAKAAPAVTATLGAKAVGKTAEAAGKAVQATGRGLSTPLKVAGGVAGAVKGVELGGLAGGAVGAAAGARGGKFVAQSIVKGGKILEKTGDKIFSFGKQLAGEVPAGPSLRALQVAGKVAASTPVKAAAIGAASAAPLAFLTNDDVAAANILAGGAAIGGAAGVGIGAARGLRSLRERHIGGKLLDPFSRTEPPVVPESDAYGIAPELDNTHSAAFGDLPVEEQAVVNQTRELFRGDAEVYVQDQASYAQRLREIREANLGRELTPEESAQVDTFANTHAVFNAEFPTPQGPRKVVLLNKDATGLPHDTGHLFESLMPEAEREALHAEVRRRYSPEQLENVKAFYEGILNRDLPEGQRVGLSQDQVISELIAENFSTLFSNQPIESLGTPRPVAEKIAAFVARTAEKAGIDLTGGRVTPGLGAKPSFGVQGMLENALRARAQERGLTAERPATPEASATPAAPEVTPPNKRVTTAEQNAFAAEALRSAQVDVARNFAQGQRDPKLTKTVESLTSNFQRKPGQVAPIELELLGAKEVVKPGEPQPRDIREIERVRADSAEALGTATDEVRSMFQNVTVPVRFEVSAGRTRGVAPGPPNLQLLGMSLDKVAANMNMLAKDLTKRGRTDLIPYDVKDGKLTANGWDSFAKDVSTYAENQQNGFRGDGRKLVRPANAAELQIFLPEENPRFNPTVLPENVGQFINALMGKDLAAPRTPRVQAGKVPANIKAQNIAQVNLRTGEVPVRAKPLTAKQAAKQTFPTGERILEVNPLRNELNRLGFDTDKLHTVNERVRVDRIKKVTPRPELTFKAPVTDIVRGGFLPRREEGGAFLPELKTENIPDYLRELSGLGPAEFRQAMNDYPGGLTAAAVRLGELFSTPEQAAMLKELETQSGAQTRELMKAGNFDEAMSNAARTQFYREAYESATDSGSVAAARAREAAGKSKFLPKERKPATEAGKKIEEAGYKFARDMRDQSFSLFFTDANTSEKVGQIHVGVDPKNKSAYIQAIDVDEGRQRKGIGEALVREAATELQAQGIATLRGAIEGSGPVQIRERVFGEGRTKFSQGDAPISAKEAARIVDEEFGRVLAQSPVDADQRFLPRAAGEAKTEIGKRTAEENDFNVERAHGPGNYAINFRDADGKVVASITARDLAPGVAEIDSVLTDPDFRGRGIGEALYREMATDLQAAKIKQVTGNVVSDLPLRIREKVFGDFELVRNAFGETETGASAINRLREAREARERGDTSSIEFVNPVNRITENQQFLPDLAGAITEAEKRKARAAWREKGVESPYFKKWFGESKVVDSEGDPRVVYHGTTHKFNEFSPERGNPGNDFGVGFYFSSARFDAQGNYAGVGPDLKLRVDLRTDELRSEFDLSDKEAARRARRELVGRSPRVVDAYLKLEKPFVIGEGDVPATRMKMEILEHPDEGFLNEPSGEVIDFLNSLNRQLDYNLPPEIRDDIINRMLGDGPYDSVPTGDEGISRQTYEISANTLNEILRENDALSYAAIEGSNEQLKSVGSYIRDALEDAGFDGIIDQTVGEKFRHMPGIYEGVTHYIAFKPESIKSASQNKGTFGPSADIRFLPSQEIADVQIANPEDPAPSGPSLSKIEFKYDPALLADPEELTRRIKATLPQRLIAKVELAEVSKARLKRTFPEAVISDGPLFYRIADSPLARKYKKPEQKVNAFADKLTEKVNEGTKDPVIRAGYELGLRWYDDFTPLLKKRYGEDAPLFAELLAATSPNTQPRVNYYFAEEAYRRFKEGAFDKHIAEMNVGLDKLASGELQAEYERAVERGEPKKLGLIVPDKPTEKTYLAWWVRKHGIIPTQRPRVVKGQVVHPLFGMHSGAVLKVVMRRWLTENQGLKTNNFIQNLIGESKEATIDIWAARSMREAGYQDFKQRWRILPGQERRVTDVDFKFSQEAFRKAAEQLGLEPHQFQGGLWFLEKVNWAQKGWGELDLGDYRTEIQRIEQLEREAEIPTEGLVGEVVGE